MAKIYIIEGVQKVKKFSLKDNVLSLNELGNAKAVQKGIKKYF